MHETVQGLLGLAAPAWTKRLAMLAHGARSLASCTLLSYSLDGACLHELGACDRAFRKHNFALTTWLAMLTHAARVR